VTIEFGNEGRLFTVSCVPADEYIDKE